MQLLIVLTVYCILSTEALRDGNDIWYKWKHVHGKTYAGEQEENARKLQFEINLDIIAQHNLKHDVGLVSYTMRANRFSDLSRDEFKELYLCKLTRNISLTSKNTAANALNMTDINAPPTDVDWRKKGLVTRVKDQGQCGSCWAFSTTGALEGQYAKKFQRLVEFSEQQLVDCSIINHGCNGGSMLLAYNDLEDYGIESEDSYPYTAKEGECEFNAKYALAKVIYYTTFISGDENALKAAVAEYGPIAVAIDAENDLQGYHDGIYESRSCSSEKLNHAVLVVGYGTSEGKDYWIVKNSWSDAWGMSGYFLMARNKSNMCGIASDTSVPFI